MFMNILTTNGYVSRYVTDWAGPDAMLHDWAIDRGGRTHDLIVMSREDDEDL